jgi:hypothetical protein
MKVFHRKLENKKSDLAKDTYTHLAGEVDKQSATIRQMTDHIAQSIEQQLTEEMEKAILLIR